MNITYGNAIRSIKSVHIFAVYCIGAEKYRRIVDSYHFIENNLNETLMSILHSYKNTKQFKYYRWKYELIFIFWWNFFFPYIDWKLYCAMYSKTIVNSFKSTFFCAIWITKSNITIWNFTQKIEEGIYDVNISSKRKIKSAAFDVASNFIIDQ